MPGSRRSLSPSPSLASGAFHWGGGVGEKTAGSQRETWLGAAHALSGRAAGGGWLPLQASRGGERRARGEEAGGAPSLRPSSPLGGRAASVVPPPPTGAGQLLCNRLFCSPAPSERRTAARGLTEPIGGAASGCPLSFARLSSLSPIPLRASTLSLLSAI